jgi:hypothetical protein
MGGDRWILMGEVGMLLLGTVVRPRTRPTLFSKAPLLRDFEP